MMHQDYGGNMRKKSQKTTNPAGGDFLSGNLNYLDEVKDVKITKRRRSLKPVLVMLLMVTGLAGGVIMVMIDAANRPVEEVATDELESNTIDAQTRLNTCLKVAQSDVQEGDPEFYPKLIANYKTQIDCYNKFDSENPTKQGLENELGNTEIAARNAGISQAAIDAEYNRKAAQIEEDYRVQMAALDARAAKQDAETRRWLQEDAENAARRQAEWKSEQAQYDAQQKARDEANTRAEQGKIAKCNAYRAQYGDKSAEELARTDASVVQAYNKWQNWSQKAQTYNGPELSQAQCQAAHSNHLWDPDWVCPSKSRYENKANEAKVYYDQLFTKKVQAYISSRKLACGY